ncbi:MAG: DUF3794 domain-containing protein [Tepidibacter sp.]|jgi:hypothetical protein|uniref:SPOCS domain-containing protein n=1 Tax=Tepidibacter sp. TaxID=2529387 RepID=UPI0025DA02B9|nr:SPOCS domain-containing protein [Tepidibacter sp.]MCT4508390.1 DUF3794 domain-containing protein [Tepidibacter sp.]
MNSELDNIVQTFGISQTFPSYSNTFKQLHTQKISYIDDSLPDIYKFLRTSASLEILNSKIISSSKGISSEGQILTGNQLIVNGNINQTLEYIANDIDKSIQATEFIIPFSTYIILNKQFLYDSKLKIVPYIEDIYINQISKRKFFISIMSIINVNYLL